MKSASLAAGVFTAAFLRALFGTLLIAPIWLARGGRWPELPVLQIHLLRGTVSAFMALTFFYSITKLPLAVAIAISFIAPLVALYLAAIQLGENIAPASIRASLLGFAGTIVIISGRLRSAEFDDDSLLGLAAILFSALLYAWNFILIRKQALLASPEEATTFHSGVTCCILLLASPWLFVVPTSAVLLSTGVAALLTVSGAFTLTWAYARAEAQVLVPIEYTGFLWAALFGWLFFAEDVAPATLAGAGLIVIGCLIAARRRPEQSAI